jgi:hypothetical protein
MARSEACGCVGVRLRGRKVNGSIRANKNIGKTRQTFPVEELAAVFPSKGDTPGKLAHELDDLSDVVVVLGIPGP